MDWHIKSGSLVANWRVLRLRCCVDEAEKVIKNNIWSAETLPGAGGATKGHSHRHDRSVHDRYARGRCDNDTGRTNGPWRLKLLGEGRQPLAVLPTPSFIVINIAQKITRSSATAEKQRVSCAYMSS